MDGRTERDFRRERIKEDVASLLERLPDDCSLEDVRYHVHVLAKVRRGLASAESEGVAEQEEAEARLGRWLAG